MKIDKETLKIVVLGLALAIIGIWGFNTYAYQPLKVKGADLDKKLKEKQMELDETEKIVANLEIKKAEFGKLKEQLAYVVTRLPGKKEMPELIRTITSIGLKNELQISSFSPEGIISKEVYDEVPIRLIANARYHNLGLFLSKIGSLERILIPSQLSLSAAQPTQKDPSTVSAEMVITAFVYKAGP